MGSKPEPPDQPDRVDVATFEAFRDGDMAAMATIVAVYSRPLIGYIRTVTRSQEVAEEIAQEVFLKTWSHRERIIDPQRLRSWFFTLSRREAIREMKRKRHKVEFALDGQAMEQIAGTELPTQRDGLSAHDLGEALQKPLEKLGKRDRELIILRYFCNLQIKEIAEIMEMPMGTVGVYLQRALEKLRKQFKIAGINPDDLF